MLRRASASVPVWRARASVSACSGFNSSVTVLPTTTFWPSFSFGAWSIASTRTLARMISELTISAEADLSGFLSRFERITSTRSLGRMKPPAPVSGEISVEMARMPVGRIAAMKPDPLALTSFGSRIGSPARNGARAIEPETSLVASGRSLRRIKLWLAVAAGHVCHCATGSGGADVLSDPRARYAATPPALRARIRTPIRAVYIRFTIYFYAGIPELHGGDSLSPTHH